MLRVVVFEGVEGFFHSGEMRWATAVNREMLCVPCEVAKIAYSVIDSEVSIEESWSVFSNRESFLPFLADFEDLILRLQVASGPTATRLRAFAKALLSEFLVISSCFGDCPSELKLMEVRDDLCLKIDTTG